MFWYNFESMFVLSFPPLMHCMTLPLVYGSKQSHYRVHCDVFTHNMSGVLALVIDSKNARFLQVYET